MQFFQIQIAEMSAVLKKDNSVCESISQPDPVGIAFQEVIEGMNNSDSGVYRQLRADCSQAGLAVQLIRGDLTLPLF